MYSSDKTIQDLLGASRYKAPNSLPNIVIINSGKGSYDFEVFSSVIICDLGILSSSQIFPRFIYNEELKNKNAISLFSDEELHKMNVDFTNSNFLFELEDEDRIIKVYDNILNETLDEYIDFYSDPKISKDDIFFYIYGLQHHPQYQKKYHNNLIKDLARIPMAPDFWRFKLGGEYLMRTHNLYEFKKGYPNLRLEVKADFDKTNDEHFRFEKLKWDKKRKDKTTLGVVVNELLTIGGIPKSAQKFRVGAKTPIAWILESCRIKIDTDESGIINDTNNLFEDPRDFIKLFSQVISSAVRSQSIVKRLPKEFE